MSDRTSSGDGMARGTVVGDRPELVLVGSQRAHDLLAEALGACTADDLEVSLAARTSSVLRFAGGRVHQPQDLTALQLMVRAVVGGHSARVAVSSPALLGDAVARACSTVGALASSSGAGGAAGRPPPAPPVEPRPDVRRPDTRRAEELSSEEPSSYEPSSEEDRSERLWTDRLWSDSTAAWDAGRRAADIAALHRAALHPAGGPPGVDLAGTLAAGTTELAVATTGGLRRYAVATEASLSLTAECGDGSAHAEELGRAAADIDVAGIGAALIAEAVRMQHPEELAPGRYDVVLGPLAVAELIAFLPSFGFTAPALSAGIGVVAAGDRRLSPLVTVVDDATDGPGLPWPFDLEGTTKQRVTMIRDGRPEGVVSDLATATVTGGSTGHAHIAREEAPAPRAANLRLEAGTASTGELVAGVIDGVYIQRLWYTRLVDAPLGIITGTTRDAAFRIRDGRLGAPIRGMRFTESVLDALERTDGIGDRLVSQPMLNIWNGAASAPALRVRGFRLGVIGASGSRPSGSRPSGRGRRP